MKREQRGGAGTSIGRIGAPHDSYASVKRISVQAVALYVKSHLTDVVVP